MFQSSKKKAKSAQRTRCAKDDVPVLGLEVNDKGIEVEGHQHQTNPQADRLLYGVS